MKHFKLLCSIILALSFLNGLTLAQDTTLAVTGDGNVGIGTNNPQAKLHVNGLARFDLNGGQINISTPGGNPGIIGIAPSGHRRDIILDNYGIRLLVSPTSGAPGFDNGINITEDGNVGIGASNISDKLVVNGNAHIAGKITSGDAKVSLPIAYGVINTDGSVSSATSNVSCSWNAGAYRYEIGITGESYLFRDYVTTVEPIGDSQLITSTSSVGGKLIVQVYNISGIKIQSLFQFVVYKL